jgi:hypothetical protein
MTEIGPMEPAGTAALQHTKYVLHCSTQSMYGLHDLPFAAEVQR